MASNSRKKIHYEIVDFRHIGVNDTAVQLTLSNIFEGGLTHCFFMRKSDPAAHGTAVSMTPLCKYETAVTFDLIFWLP
jgi:hypothetical protein